GPEPTGSDMTSSDRRSDMTSSDRQGNESAEAKEKSPLDRITDSIRTPTGGATVAGVIGLTAATMFGVVETLVGAGAAYGVYRLVCKRQRNR
ncbi:MAG: hypothetical protein FWD17_18150, partial [Polyangiaceae bacterium]|nr:hypothetical protein [Polyangiaceae bacterium]